MCLPIGFKGILQWPMYKKKYAVGQKNSTSNIWYKHSEIIRKSWYVQYNFMSVVVRINTATNIIAPIDYMIFILYFNLNSQENVY